MDFQISPLHIERFSHLFGQDNDGLSMQGVQRIVADSDPGYPCRVSLQDAKIGESVLLMNYEHQPALSPYRSSHAIFVREGARTATTASNEVPEMLRIRLISVRAFDETGMMVDADIGEGDHLEKFVNRMLSMPSVSYLHLHNAQRGCFMARVERA